MSDAPDQLLLDRHRDLGRRAHGPWIRRALVASLCLLPIAGLGNVFGQRATVERTHSAEATLAVTAPSAVRGGLLYDARIEVVAHAALAHPKLVMDRGWFEAVSVNTVIPEPSDEATRNGRVVLNYAALEPGQRLVVWINFQVNPLNIGRRSQDIRLEDGGRTLGRITRTLTIYP